MSRNVLEKFIGASQAKNKIKCRKSLQTLQVTSDEQGIAGENMVLPDKEAVPSKKSQTKVANKAIVTEKENTPVLRRSKRKNVISGVLNYVEPPDFLKTSKSVSVKSKKGRPTTSKKNKPEIDLNQKKLNFPSVTSMLNKSSDVSESVYSEKNMLVTSASSEVKVTKDSSIDPDNGESSQSSVHSIQVSETCVIKHPTGIPNEETILTCANPPLLYWEELAEERKVALEKTLHENELLHDQLTVLEAENSQLKQLLKEAENLAQIVRDIIQ